MSERHFRKQQRRRPHLDIQKSLPERRTPKRHNPYQITQDYFNGVAERQSLLEQWNLRDEARQTKFVESFFRDLQRETEQPGTDRPRELLRLCFWFTKEIASGTFRGVEGEPSLINRIFPRLQRMTLAEIAGLSLPADPRLDIGRASLRKAPTELTDADVEALRGLWNYVTEWREGKHQPTVSHVPLLIGKEQILEAIGQTPNVWPWILTQNRKDAGPIQTQEGGKAIAKHDELLTWYNSLADRKAAMDATALSRATVEDGVYQAGKTDVAPDIGGRVKEKRRKR